MADSPEVMVEHYRELKREKILAMKSGREMDCLIIQQVFKKHLWNERPNWYLSEGTPESSEREYCKVPRFSTDISAAIEAAEKLGTWQLTKFGIGLPPRQYRAIVKANQCTAYAETASLALSRAALLAVMDT